jgi:RNA polymerase sigma-70 factor (ECF subfamily)
LQRILQLYERSHAAEYGFTQREFCEMLVEIARRSLGEGASDREQGLFFDTLHLEDLVLAQACASGHESAWEQFVKLFKGKLYAAALSITCEASAARELADSVYADLFGTRTDKDGQRKSKLALYSGRGSLDGWLRTVLAQSHIDRIRRDQKLVAFDEAVELPNGGRATLEPTGSDARLTESTDAALAALAPEEKLLLAAYYLDGRTLAEIGRMLSLHESTVARRLDKTVVRLRKRIIAQLRALGVSKQAAQEMLDIDVRDLGIDVSRRLAQEGRR